MEVHHEVKLLPKGSTINSIFKLFSDLTSDKNKNPKYFLKLLETLYGKPCRIGSTNNTSYSVKRVLKALCSTRLQSQCGCFAALTCIIKYGACTPENVLLILENEVKSIQGVTKLELRALDIGSLLTCGAIVHSGLFREQTSEVQRSVLNTLICVGKKKKYFFPVACKFIVDSINQLNEDYFEENVWPLCKIELFDDGNEWDIDMFYLFTTCVKKNSKLLQKFIKTKYKSHEIFIQKLINSLFTASNNFSHPIFKNAVELLCKSNKYWVEIWHQFVEENASKGASKDATLITIFFHITSILNEVKYVPLLLTPKFIDVLMSVLSGKKSQNLRKMVKEAFYFIAILCKSDKTPEAVKLDTVTKLLLYPANLKFEIKTGIKIIHTLILTLNSFSVEELLNLYRKMITDESNKIINSQGDNVCWSLKEKQIILGSVVKTINHPAIKSNATVKLEYIKFISDIAFSKKNSFSLDLRKCARENFFKAIIFPMLSLRDLVLLLDMLSEYLNDQILQKKLEISDEICLWWNKQFLVVQKLKKKKNKLFNAVCVLLIYMSFQLFVDKKLAVSGIDELLSCYLHLPNDYKRTKSHACEGENDENCSTDVPHWTEVTMDLIFSLLSRGNKLWRRIITCIFPEVIKHSTPMAFQQIINILDPYSQSVILEQVNSDDSDDPDDSDDSDDSDSEKEDSESDMSTSNQEDIEDIENDEKANDKLRSAVRDALGYSAALTDDESVDMDEMDEEQEKTLNAKLSEAFKLFKGTSRKQKKVQTKDEEALMHFRLRVLDLVEIYISNSPSMEGCLDLILSLLNLLEFCVKNHNQEPLKCRVNSALKSISQLKSFTNESNFNKEKIKEVLNVIIKKKDISTLVFVEMSPRMTDCLTFLVRCSQLDTDDVPFQPLVEGYECLIKAFFQTQDHKFSILMFQTIMKMSWKGNFYLIGTFFKLLLTPSVKTYKKLKILELLQLFYKNEKLHSNYGKNFILDLNKKEKNFIKKFSGILATFSDDKSTETQKIYSNFFSQLIALINVIRNCIQKHRREIKENAPWESLILILAQVKIVSQNKKTFSKLASLASLYNLNIVKRIDRKRKKSVNSVDDSVKINTNDLAFKQAKKKKL